MEAVAVAAGVSKATIYRRWSSKIDLLVSVIEHATDASLGPVETGSLRDDLISLLSSLRQVLAGPGGNASRALLGAGSAEPALAEAFRQGPMRRWHEAFQAAFGAAVARGEIRPGAGTSLAAEAGPSILLKRWMITGQQIDEALPAAVVDEVMLPLLGRPRTER